MSEETLDEFDLAFSLADERRAFFVRLGQVPTQVDPNEMTRVCRTVWDVVLLEKGGRAAVRLAEAGLVQSEVGRQTDGVEEQVGPQDVLNDAVRSVAVYIDGERRGTNRGARNLHQERVRLHRDVQVRIRLTDENSETEAVYSKVLARTVDAVDPRWVATCVDERVER